LILKVALLFSLTGVAVATHDAMKPSKTIVFDGLTAQTRMEVTHSPYFARLIVEQYSADLDEAFKSEPSCHGFHYSLADETGEHGGTGRWILAVDLSVNDNRYQAPSIQPWSLTLSHRDGDYSLQPISGFDETAGIIKQACAVVKNNGTPPE
jgi:hypothetical protein